MAKESSTKRAREASPKPQTATKRTKARDARPAATIRFTAILSRPQDEDADQVGGSFVLNLSQPASAKLPSRGMVSVQGTFNGARFRATLQPDGRGGHWLKVDRKLSQAVGAQVGQVAALEISPVPVDEEPEPEVPADLRQALAAAPAQVRAVWSDITPIARRDWIQWVTSGKLAKTRALRIDKACDMLANGKRRPCCFDRTGGMYGQGRNRPGEDAPAT